MRSVQLRTRVIQLSRVLGFGLISLGFCGITIAQEANPGSQSSAPLRLQDTLAIDLAPLQSRLIEVPVPMGSAAVVSVGQSLGTVEVRSLNTANADEPRTNLAGLQSRITLHLLAHSDGIERISIRNASATKPAAVSV